MAGSNLFSIFGFVLCIVAAALIVLAFSTPYWVEPEKGKTSIARFEKIGLWEMCFLGYQSIYDGAGRNFNGCWWVFAREYDSIRKYLLPEWFVATQALMTMSVAFVLLGVLFGLLLLLGIFPERMKKWVAAALCLGTYGVGLLVIIGLIYFGTNAEVDRTWLSQATYRHLSWSFYVMCIGGALVIFSGMCYTVYYIKIRKSGQNRTAYRAHELRHYRSDHYRTEHHSERRHY